MLLLSTGNRQKQHCRQHEAKHEVICIYSQLQLPMQCVYNFRKQVKALEQRVKIIPFFVPFIMTSFYSPISRETLKECKARELMK